MLENIREGMSNVFEKRITLGNVIEIIVLLVAIITAYSKLSWNQDLLQRQVEEQKATTQILAKETAEKAAMAKIEAEYVRVDTHKLQMQMITDKLQEIQDDLKDIKRRVTK